MPLTKKSSVKVDNLNKQTFYYKHKLQVALISDLFYYKVMTKNLLETSIKRLWLAYKAYHIASCRNGADPSEYATITTNEFLDYLIKQKENGYNWHNETAIENQIRILKGFIECYDRPVIRDKITNKTRRWV